MLLTINNPLYDCDSLQTYIEQQIKGSYYCCYSFERGLKEQTPHCHIFFNFDNPRSGNAIKKLFPTAHIDYCSGTNQSIRDYIFKQGKWKGNSKEETKIEGTQWENKNCHIEIGQGNRSDIDYITEMLDKGKNPQEILNSNLRFYKHETMIKKVYFDKRYSSTPATRDVNVVVHVGKSGSGKSHIMTKFSDEELFLYSDYSRGGMDLYNGQNILFMDEFRGELNFQLFLTMLDGYRVSIPARYNNVYSLWNEVHITSVLPPEDWYCNTNKRDTFEQLKRRISSIVFHWKEKDAFNKDAFHDYKINMTDYTCYDDLELEARKMFESKQSDIFANVESTQSQNEPFGLQYENAPNEYLMGNDEHGYYYAHDPLGLYNENDPHRYVIGNDEYGYGYEYSPRLHNKDVPFFVR